MCANSYANTMLFFLVITKVLKLRDDHLLKKSTSQKHLFLFFFGYAGSKNISVFKIGPILMQHFQSPLPLTPTPPLDPSYCAESQITYFFLMTAAFSLSVK